MAERNNAIRESHKKKKHSAIKRLVFLFWCVLFLCIGIGISFLIGFIQKRNLPTQKIVQVSPAPECVAKACIWLSGVDEEYWDYDKVSSIFSDLSVDVQGDYIAEEKTWQWTVSDESFAACEDSAYDKLGVFFKDIIVKEGNIETNIDEKLTELLGMPLSDYLRTCDIDLMPSKEELLSKVLLLEQGGTSNEK